MSADGSKLDHVPVVPSAVFTDPSAKKRVAWQSSVGGHTIKVYVPAIRSGPGTFTFE